VADRRVLSHEGRAETQTADNPTRVSEILLHEIAHALLDNNEHSEKF
jgi:hypothetical protein